MGTCRIVVFAFALVLTCTTCQPIRKGADSRQLSQQSVAGRSIYKEHGQKKELRQIRERNGDFLPVKFTITESQTVGCSFEVFDGRYYIEKNSWHGRLVNRSGPSVDIANSDKTKKLQEGTYEVTVDAKFNEIDPGKNAEVWLRILYR